MSEKSSEKIDPKVNKKKDLKKRLILTSVSSAVVLGSLFLYPEGKSASEILEEITTSPEALAAPGEQEVQHLGGWRNDAFYYPTPEPNFIEKLFCKGFRNSSACSREPLHPHNESRKHYGTELVDPDPQRRFTELLD